MATFNVNTEAVENMTARIAAAGKNAIPRAIQGTLNSLAFDMKKRTLPKSAKDTFTERQKTFFKAFSRVNVAKFGTVESMRSEVGFYDRGAKSPQAVEDLDQQEHGGRIAGRSFVPLDTARVGKSRNRMVSAKNRLGRISRIVNSADAKGKNRQEKFFKSMLFAGVGGAVIGNFEPNILYRVTAIDKVKGKLRIKKTPLYTYDKGRAVKVDQTRFSQMAANETASGVRNIWIREGNRVIRQQMYR
jgi:hypothetical protein